MSEEKSVANSVQNSAPRPVPPQLLANQFKPGQSGNPSGRPKTKPLTEQIWKMIDERSEDELKAFRANLWRKLNSDRMVSPMILNICLDRVEGKLASMVEIQGEIDIKTIIEQGRKRIADDDDAPILDAEEIPQLPAGETEKE